MLTYQNLQGISVNGSQTQVKDCAGFPRSLCRTSWPL